MLKAYRTKIFLGFALAICVQMILLEPAELLNEPERSNEVEESAQAARATRTAPQPERAPGPSVSKQRDDQSLSAGAIEEFAVRSSLVQEGKLAPFMDAVFSPQNLAAIRDAFGDRLRFRAESRAQAAEESANQFFESHYQLPLRDLNLSPETERRARSVIVDDTRRRSELVTLWTDREIDFAEYRLRSDSLPDINARLANVLSPTELSDLNLTLSTAAKAREFSPEFVSGYEESRRGSLYPLVQRGDIEALVSHLEAGADPNEARQGDSDISLLSLAVSVGSEEAVTALIDHGADIDFTHADGDSLLHRAATQGSVTITERLLISGADATARNQMGLTPRMTAIVAGLRHSGDAHANIERLVEAAENAN